jgi:hypothetical protein
VVEIDRERFWKILPARYPESQKLETETEMETKSDTNVHLRQAHDSIFHLEVFHDRGLVRFVVGSLVRFVVVGSVHGSLHLELESGLGLGGLVDEEARLLAELAAVELAELETLAPPTLPLLPLPVVVVVEATCHPNLGHDSNSVVALLVELVARVDEDLGLGLGLGFGLGLVEAEEALAVDLGLD